MDELVRSNKLQFEKTIYSSSQKFENFMVVLAL
jgi:hypothetical protein